MSKIQLLRAIDFADHVYVDHYEVERVTYSNLPEPREQTLWLANEEQLTFPAQEVVLDGAGSCQAKDSEGVEHDFNFVVERPLEAKDLE